MPSALDAFARSGLDMSETSVDLPVTTSEKRVFSAFHSGLDFVPNTPFGKSSQVTSSDFCSILLIAAFLSLGFCTR